MSRRKTQAEIDAEIEAEEARQSEIYRNRRECGHWNCAPVEWYWSGQIRVMRCSDCGEENHIDEVEHDHPCTS